MNLLTKPAFLCLCALTVFLPYACGRVAGNRGYRSIRPTVTPAVAARLDSIKKTGSQAFAAFRYTASDGTALNYRLLSPPLPSPTAKYPLVVFFHGSGAIGADNDAQLGVPARLWARPEIRRAFPAYVLAPQFPARSSDYAFSPHWNALVSSPRPVLHVALQLIDSLKANPAIDPDRIYVLGFSMGGSSALDALTLRPDLFAAAVSVAPVPNLSRPDRLGAIPIWLVHGNADAENPFAGSKLLYRELTSRGFRRVRFWEYEGLGHGLFPQLYAGDEIPRWLFRQRKRR